jgi:hypothetical protein
MIDGRRIAVCALCVNLSLVAHVTTAADSPMSPQTRTPATTTRAQGLGAWQRMYSVLTHPRCVNCHTAGGYPQQGDDRHPHAFNVVRGSSGFGAPAYTCMACHQVSNADATGIPGASGWHLAPLSMKWQSLDDRVLPSATVCRAITDRSKNHNLDGPALLKHHEEDALVLWAFSPGPRSDGTPRSLPPLTHADFVAATRTWVDAGMPCPTR